MEIRHAKPQQEILCNYSNIRQREIKTKKQNRISRYGKIFHCHKNFLATGGIINLNLYI